MISQLPLGFSKVVLSLKCCLPRLSRVSCCAAFAAMTAANLDTDAPFIGRACGRWHRLCTPSGEQLG